MLPYLDRHKGNSKNKRERNRSTSGSGSQGMCYNLSSGSLQSTTAQQNGNNGHGRRRLSSHSTIRFSTNTNAHGQFSSATNRNSSNNSNNTNSSSINLNNNMGMTMGSSSYREASFMEVLQDDIASSFHNHLSFSSEYNIYDGCNTSNSDHNHNHHHNHNHNHNIFNTSIDTTCGSSRHSDIYINNNNNNNMMQMDMDDISDHSNEDDDDDDNNNNNNNGDDMNMNIPEMNDIDHPQIELIDGTHLVRREGIPKNEKIDYATVMDGILEYVHNKLLSTYQMKQAWIYPKGEARCPIYLSKNWDSFDPPPPKKMLVLIQNQHNSQPGIWSRSLSIENGLKRGTMLEYVDTAIARGYSVLICNPNYNSVEVMKPNGETGNVTIPGSETPENHIISICDQIIANCGDKEIYLVGFTRGCFLVKEMLQRHIANHVSFSYQYQQYPPQQHQQHQHQRVMEFPKIMASAMIESCPLIEQDDTSDICHFLRSRCINWACSNNEPGESLQDAAYELGVARCISLGCSTSNLPIAWGISSAMEPIFDFFDHISKGGEIEEIYPMNPQNLPQPPPTTVTTIAQQQQQQQKTPTTIEQRWWENSNETWTAATSMQRRDSFEEFIRMSEKVSIEDFALQKVVGKGCFGKVLKVQKKKGRDANTTYAMKVMSKDVIMAKDMRERILSERSVLSELEHPYLMKLYYAFQSKKNLYLVMEFCARGNLMSLIRNLGVIPEYLACFYGAEVCSAIGHLHKHRIIYRDVKLENVLVTDDGHISLTDFGFSKQVAEGEGGLKTFCGTPEYVAPELILRQPYTFSADWWSFGILLFEMMAGCTPFHNQNPRILFQNIVYMEPQYPPYFSYDACSIIHSLLMKNAEVRLGSGAPKVLEITNHMYFKTIDWDELAKKNITPPVNPPELTRRTTIEALGSLDLRGDNFSASIANSLGSTFKNFSYTPNNNVGVRSRIKSRSIHKRSSQTNFLLNKLSSDI